MEMLPISKNVVKEEGIQPKKINDFRSRSNPKQTKSNRKYDENRLIRDKLKQKEKSSERQSEKSSERGSAISPSKRMGRSTNSKKTNTPSEKKGSVRHEIPSVTKEPELNHYESRVQDLTEENNELKETITHMQQQLKKKGDEVNDLKMSSERWKSQAQ
jgi:predicted  nucleic acid-binding Zn-ribbon protein